MKVRNRMIKGLLAVSAMTVLLAQTVFAADPEPYTYTVTLSAGNQGTLTGTEGIRTSGTVIEANGKIVISDLSYGDTIVFENPQNYVAVSDDKYYALGVRESGLDNSDLVGTLEVTDDADYVVAYGIAGNMVQYTVNYQDADGNQLAESRTFYGAVGDKPVVAFQYIEGYVPQAYNLTKTLSENGADNVFTFQYTPIPEGTVIVQPGQTVTTTTTPATGTTAAATGTAAGGTAAAGAGTAAAGTADQGTTAGEAQDAGDTATIDEDQTPQGTVDLDEDDVPLGNKKADESVRETSAVPIVLGVIGAIAAVVIIAGAVIYFRKHS